MQHQCWKQQQAILYRWYWGLCFHSLKKRENFQRGRDTELFLNSVGGFSIHGENEVGSIKMRNDFLQQDLPGHYTGLGFGQSLWEISSWNHSCSSSSSLSWKQRSIYSSLHNSFYLLNSSSFFIHMHSANRLSSWREWLLIIITSSLMMLGLVLLPGRISF